MCVSIYPQMHIFSVWKHFIIFAAENYIIIKYGGTNQLSHKDFPA